VFVVVLVPKTTEKEALLFIINSVLSLLDEDDLGKDEDPTSKQNDPASQ
jgi:hypothetical protein